MIYFVYQNAAERERYEQKGYFPYFCKGVNFKANSSAVIFMAKLPWPRIGHPSKPQNASKLRIGLNIYCDPFQVHKRYLQDVG